MKAHSSNLFLFCAIITTQIRFQALSDTTSTDTNQRMPLIQQQQQQQLQLHHRMSCYACSTMDYENTADNLCKEMKYHQRSPSSLPQHTPNLANVGHHPSSMMNHQPPTTTTTAASSQAGSSDMMIPMETLVLPSSPAYDDDHMTSNSGTWSSSQLTTQQQPLAVRNMSQGHYNDSQLVNTTSMLAQQQTSIVANHHGIYPQVRQRIPSLGNSIRIRPCLDDENFCSIVSVVRIEFINDNFVSRFWAMERNCSKSCNTGCMLIGERVRLRVCSQCCRTPNCNIGKGASTSFISNSYQFITLLLSLIMANVLYVQSVSNIEFHDQKNRNTAPSSL